MSERDDWSRHWDEYAESAARNPAQDYRRHLIFQGLRLSHTGEDVKLLDVGSGQGDFAAEAHSLYSAAQILGLELSDSGVALSRRKVPDATFLECNLLGRDPVPEAFRKWATHAVCSEVIEHVDDPVMLLREARSYMAAGCTLFLTAPGGPMSAFDRHIGHRKHFTPSELRSLLIAAGYEPEFATGAGYPFFNLYRRVVITRGERLIDDVKSGDGQVNSAAARLAMSAFSLLFKCNASRSPRGWQMIARARVPA